MRSPTRIEVPLTVLLLLAGIAGAVIAGAVGAVAASRFSDVPDDSVHAPGIGWMVGAGVTAGCGGDRFCPADGVTRAQMGTFLHRLSGNAPGVAPSVNAATVQGRGPEDLVGPQGPAGPQGEPGPPGEIDQAVLDALIARLDVLEVTVARQDRAINSLQSELETATSRLAAFDAMLAGVSRVTLDGRDTLRFSRMNLQVVNGSGTTVGTPNALGNLIIGYDTPRDTGSDKAGSHYLVVGDRHNYTRSSGIVVGYFNTATGDYASVTGGSVNVAGDYASVTGGGYNVASGVLASVSGGYHNTASGVYSSVSGGDHNAAAGHVAWASGGISNTASGDRASVSGGGNNTAGGDKASVSGGNGNTASGANASVSGGYRNTASGALSSVSGGDRNAAAGAFSSILGGYGQTVATDYGHFPQ